PAIAAGPATTAPGYGAVSPTAAGSGAYGSAPATVPAQIPQQAAPAANDYPQSPAFPSANTPFPSYGGSQTPSSYSEAGSSNTFAPGSIGGY
ncbi:MAG: hypothetical protein Q4G68_00820, partial [Planctomycetia bacterium]|nr:hypothetical protein [Planctomycetia bacterium]